MRPSDLIRSLSDAGVAEPEYEAAILAEKFCGMPRSRFIIKDTEFDPTTELEAAIRRRAAGEPIQYIVGTWCFMNEEYEVTPDVLIPRADTESLVEWAIKNIPRGGIFADLCTGSGCVAISTLAARRDLTCVAVDISRAALEVAKRNAERNGVSDRVKFVFGDVLSGEGVGITPDVILANPPYVTADEYKSLRRELYFEPKDALTDGGDGLSFYRSILGKYGAGVFALEIGAAQAKDVSAIASERGMTVEIIKDLGGRDRVAVCRRRQ